MSNTEQKIFTIKMHKETDQLLVDTFIQALKKKAFEMTNDERYVTEPYHPGVSWIVYKGYNPKINYKDSNWWLPLAVQQLEDDFIAMGKTNTKLRLENLSEENKETIERAKYLIERTWPEASVQIEQFVTNIVNIEGDFPETGYTGSSGWSYGTVFARLNPLNSVEVIEALLHEAGHIVLMTKQAFGKMIVNYNDKAFSPIVGQDRWLNGLLHASFALVRVCEGLIRLESIETELTVDEKEMANRLYKEYLGELIKSLKNLDEHAIYTEDGEGFVQEIREKLIKMEPKKELFEKPTIRFGAYGNHNLFVGTKRLLP